MGVKTLYVQAGSPWENGHSESFNGKFGDECLNSERFGSLREAQVPNERWRQRYNQVRPHGALGYRPPAPKTILPLPLDSAPLHAAAPLFRNLTLEQ